MPFPSTIYCNPLIGPGYYWAKVVDLRTEHCGMERPRIWLQLQIGPMHEEAAGLRLCSIIHPTDASIYYYVNFVNAFRIAGMNFHQALRRWASVKVAPARWGKAEYSEITYTYQPQMVRLNAVRLERAEAEGRLEEVVQGGHC